MLAKQIKEAPDDMFLTRSKFMLRDRLSKMFELFIWNFTKFRFSRLSSDLDLTILMHCLVVQKLIRNSVSKS